MVDEELIIAIAGVKGKLLQTHTIIVDVTLEPQNSLFQYFQTPIRTFTINILLNGDQPPITGNSFYLLSNYDKTTKFIPKGGNSSNGELIFQVNDSDDNIDPKTYSLMYDLDFKYPIKVLNISFKPQMGYTLNSLWKSFINHFMKKKEEMKDKEEEFDNIHTSVFTLLYYLREGRFGPMVSEYAFEFLNGCTDPYYKNIEEANCKVSRYGFEKNGFITFCVLSIKFSNIQFIKRMAYRTLQQVNDFIVNKTVFDEIINFIGRSFSDKIIDIHKIDRIKKIELIQDWIFEMSLLREGKTDFYDNEMQQDYTSFYYWDTELAQKQELISLCLNYKLRSYHATLDEYGNLVDNNGHSYDSIQQFCDIVISNDSNVANDTNSNDRIIDEIIFKSNSNEYLYGTFKNNILGNGKKRLVNIYNYLKGNENQKPLELFTDLQQDKIDKDKRMEDLIQNLDARVQKLEDLLLRILDKLEIIHNNALESINHNVN